MHTVSLSTWFNDRPLLQGQLVQRYKRFLADIALPNGDRVTAHCPNSGKLLGMPTHPLVLISDHGTDTQRKLRYTFEWFKDETSNATCWVGANTHDANRLADTWVSHRLIPELSDYTSYQREVKYADKSRIDFLLKGCGNDHLDHYVEVKSVHLKRNEGHVEFPDCPTSRGVKHMEALVQMVQAGHRATVLYVVQRDDCDTFSYARDLDPAYAAAADNAKKMGVQILCYAARLDPDQGISLSHRVSVLST